MAFELVVIGTSAGGLAALEVILAALPASFALPIVLVQHRSAESDLLCEVLQARTELQVRESLDKEPIAPGVVYIAPADYHLIVERGELSLSCDEPVRYARPSIDVTFLSAADAYGPGVVGVVLTGANADGAAGAQRIEARGGLVLVEDPRTAEISRMPAAAVKATTAAEVLSLEGIAARLLALAASPARPGRRV